MAAPLFELRDPCPAATKALVLGAGRSGIACARLLRRFEHEVVLADEREDLDIASLEDATHGATIALGQWSLDGFDLVVASPGFRPSSPAIEECRSAGIETIGEIELAFRACEGKVRIVAITGTDGKTTTTMLLAKMLEHGGQPAPACGNIGVPLTEALLDWEATAWLTVEVSAFQLWSSPTFRPDVLVATNIADDHMDYFDGDGAAYEAAKRKPLGQMPASSTLVLNLDDPVVGGWADHTDARILGYSSKVRADGYLTDGHFVFGETASLPLERFPLRGVHNRANALAAGLGARACGVDLDAIEGALESFSAPSHRIEHIATIDEIEWFDDSKATNAHAAIAGLAAVDGPVVLIAGGVDKRLDLRAWIEAMREPVVAAVLIGELTTRLRAEMAAADLDAEIVEADSMDEAVLKSGQLACKRAARTVLLSPGCSSFDMFTSYKARGIAFSNAVRALASSGAP